MTLKLKDIEEAVAEMYRIPVEVLHINTHKRDSVRPRQIAMYLARELTGLQPKQIAGHYNRHRKAAIYGAQRIEYLTGQTPAFKETVESIRSRLLNSDMREAA